MKRLSDTQIKQFIDIVNNSTGEKKMKDRIIKETDTENSKGSEFTLTVPDKRDAYYAKGIYQLVRTGNKWTKEYKNSVSVQIEDDGNGIVATVYRDHTRKNFDLLRLDYAEAAELGMALQEFTRLDPFAPEPLYEVFEKVEKKKAAKTKKRKK